MNIAGLLPSRIKFIQISFSISSELSEECSSCLCMLGGSAELVVLKQDLSIFLFFRYIKPSYTNSILMLISLCLFIDLPCLNW